MTEGVDPEDLPGYYQPSDVEVRTRERPVFVAHATVTDEGWLYTIDWDGNRVYFPPTQVVRVDRHTVEDYDAAEDPDSYSQAYRLADPALRQFAVGDMEVPPKEAPADD